MTEKRPGWYDKETGGWSSPLSLLDPEDLVYVHSNGQVLRAGAAVRASWRPEIPLDVVTVVRWADGTVEEGAQAILDEDRVLTGVGGYVDIVTLVVVIVLLLIVLKVFHFI